MDFSALQAFSSVAETGSFSRAGEALFITQPAVSKRIAVLEAELGVRLFDRLGRRVNITEAGQALLPHARRILREVRESRQAIAALGGRIGGHLTVGTSHHIGLHRLPPVLRRFTGAFPEVELDLHFLDSEQACEAVMRGELELGVVTLPGTADPLLVTEIVWPDPLGIVVPPEHPLCAKAPATVRDLAEWPAILPGVGTFTRRVLEAALQPYALELRVTLETNYLETIRMLVTVGLGWSALPLSMVAADLRVVAMAGLDLHRDLGLVRHARHTLTGAATAFSDLLRENCSQEA